MGDKGNHKNCEETHRSDCEAGFGGGDGRAGHIDKLINHNGRHKFPRERTKVLTRKGGLRMFELT
jgi:hypothetical protein